MSDFRNEIPINEYRLRLLPLYENKGYDPNIDTHWALNVAKEMFSIGILNYDSYTPKEDSYGKDITRQQANYSVSKTLQNHIAPDYAGNIDTVWLCRYCSFFGCSSDYLLGFIDTPLHTAYDDIPLNLKTINSIKRIQQGFIKQIEDTAFRTSFGLTKEPYNTIDMLNFVLSDPAFEKLLYALEDYIKPEYDTPMFFLDNTQAPGASGYHVPHNPIHEEIQRDNKGNIILNDNYMPAYKRYLPLIKDTATPSDYRSIEVNTAFLESVAMLQIQKHIDTIKTDYINQTKNGSDS